MATRWWKWLEAELDKPQNVLIDLPVSSDGRISRQMMSSWRTGKVPTAAVNTVGLIAKILRADTAEALRAAGHEEVADLWEADHGTSSEPPRDPEVQRVLDDPKIPNRFKKSMLRGYQAALERAAERKTQDEAAAREELDRMRRLVEGVQDDPERHTDDDTGAI